MIRVSKRRLLYRSLLGLLFLIATLCGRFLYGLHADNAAMQSVMLPPHPLPSPGATMLVVAPHCDDETLGVGGLIAEASRRGARVSVVFVTNGDGFPMAVSREYRRIRPGPEDYRRMALQRQREARAALARLGVPEERIYFLGYPDRGIAELWNRYWSPDQPYCSRFTGCSASPYVNSFHPGSRYCGRDLMADLKAVLEREHPQWLYIPHPGDDHPDHWATHCFSMAALEQLIQGGGPSVTRTALESETEAWKSVRVFTYLVHRGDWPVPQGLRPEMRLVPPAPLIGLDTQWSALVLSPAAEEEKEAALLCYRSQTAVMKRFLTSFVRRDELFGSLAPEPLARDGSDSAGWVTAITDTTQDSLLRGLEGSGDLTGVKADLEKEHLRLKLSTRLPVSPRVTYTIRLHPLGARSDAAEPFTFTFQHLRCDDDAVKAECGENSLEIDLPLWRIGRPAAVFVGAESRLGRVAIDHVSWRLLRLRPLSAPSQPPARSPRLAARPATPLTPLR